MRRIFAGALLVLAYSVRAALAADPPGDFRAPAPPGPHCPLAPGDLAAVESFRPDEPIVGTHFFYWYDIDSGAHFVDFDGTDALTDHPTRSEGYSFRSASWWRRELLDVTAAGIDFILPVYWGCPGDADSWSVVGLPPLVEAWTGLVREGKRPPRVGLFYDTSTLRHNPRGWHVDLSTDAGKEWFYATIRDFFSLVPPRMWCAVGGRPLVVLYSPGFAAKQDPALFPFVRERFRRDFATDLYLVKHAGWEGEADAVGAWGGALGLQALGVASLGPGYDHSAVPGREPLVVDREGGAFYERSWERFLALRSARRAKIVLVETWNELHEGTEVCDTREYGRRYIELTAKYAALQRAGAVLPRTGPFADAATVEWVAERAGENLGLTVGNSGDGLMEPTLADGRRCWRTRENPHGGRYVYLGLDDSFLFDEEEASLLVEVEYLDRGFGGFALEFDSIDPRGSVRGGAFKPQGDSVGCAGSGEWRRASFPIRGGRFANRCNGADLRLVVRGGDLAVRRVAAKRRGSDQSSAGTTSK